jgi:hypothetical protein
MRSMSGEGAAAALDLQDARDGNALIRRASRATFSRQRGRREEPAPHLLSRKNPRNSSAASLSLIPP